jgi:hypothetical protein
VIFVELLVQFVTDFIQLFINDSLADKAFWQVILQQWQNVVT